MFHYKKKKKSLKSEEVIWNTQISMKAGVGTKDWMKTENFIDKHSSALQKSKPADPLNNSKGSF